MCGIAGFVGAGSEADLRAMTDALVHRGPDGAGFHIEPDCALFLGHRRLAILDIAGGAQPMWDAERSVGVIFNGEIYNHRELRRELEAAGHRFRSDHSDTEVLVHGHKAWGPELPRRLNGMFAYALYDRRRRRLVLARDRFGEKPLFWRRTADAFLFASEIPALARHGASPPLELDPMGLRKFFAYALFPAPWTAFRGVRKLPAGTTLSFEIGSGRIEQESYYRFRIEPTDAAVTPARERAWAEELRHLLEQAVARRLESDVPLGLFLSGGIDSSAILALAARRLPAPEIRSFAIGFDEPSFDESAWSARVAAAIGSRHAAEICDLEGARRLLPALLAGIGEPVGDSSILPMHLLCRFTRRSVTVALSGDGGDELFAGYDPFKALRLAALYRRLIPRSVHPLVRRVAALLPARHGNMSLDFRIRRALRGAGERPALWNPLWMGALDAGEIGQLFRAPVDPEELYAEAIEAWEGAASPHPVDRTLEFFTRFYLQDGILTKTDRASMQSSLELRAPFLDNDLTEFARRLPHSAKLRRGETKALLRRALRGVVPDFALDRRKKGLGIPLSRWLAELDRPPPDPALPLDGAWLARAWEQHAAGRADWRHGLWCWYALTHALAGLRRRPAPASAPAAAAAGAGAR